MREQILEDLEQTDIVIYGAQMVAVSVYYAIKTLYGCRIKAFVVSDHKGNPLLIDHVPVMTLQEFKAQGNEEIKILIATPENYHEQIKTALMAAGYNNLVWITSKVEAALMEQYYTKLSIFNSLHSFECGEHKARLEVYLSKFYKDQKLLTDYMPPKWVYPIQAGAALTDMRVAQICDNAGENISEKNVNYSELSALYWISKHADNDYLGLYHYRRILDITEADLLRFEKNGIDVILPFPTIHYPNIGEHHKRYLKDSDWEAMQKALMECAPDYAKALPAIFEGQYFYNYNMLIAKKQVLREFCDWLFPILKRTEELSDPKGSERADRYIGYLGENLTTLYFMYHQKDLKIAHVGRRMLL